MTPTPLIPDSSKCEIVIDKPKPHLCGALARNIHNGWWVCDDCLQQARTYGGFRMEAFRRLK